MNIFVCNLSSVIKDNDLLNLFSVYGNVESVEIRKDIISGESRGFGYIEMKDDNAAQTAIEALNQTEIDTLPVTVQENGN